MLGARVQEITNHTFLHLQSANGSSEHDTAKCRKARATRPHTTETYITIADIAVSPSTAHEASNTCLQ
eukprot:727956-Pyramimonas_sp.AAC.1